MKNSGKNSWIKWAVAVACSTVYCLTMIVYRLQALFYAAIIEQYDIEREMASIPFVVAGFVRSISGFIFGILAQRFGLQRMTFIGGCLAAIGIGMSFFAKDMMFLSVTLGLLYGFGITGTALLPSIIRDYFDDGSTTISNGIVNNGPCFCAIIFPGIITYFLDEYGVPGTFLLSSGIILNTVPLIMMLKKPEKATKENLKNHQPEKCRGFYNSEMQALSSSSEENPTSSNFGHKNEDDSHYAQGLKNRNETKKNISSLKVENSPICLNHCHAESPRINMVYVKDNMASDSINKESCSYSNLPSTELQMIDDSLSCFQPDKNNRCDCNSLTIIGAHGCKKASSNLLNQSKKFNNLMLTKDKYKQQKLSPKVVEGTISLNSGNNYNHITETEQKSIPSGHSNKVRVTVKEASLFHSLTVLKDPTFIALTVAQGSLFYTLHIFLATMVDYSRDKKIDRGYEIYFLTLNPITDALGRIGLAWVVDKGYLSVSNFGAILSILLAISNVWMALATNFAMMTFGIMISTFGLGAFINICPGMCYAFIEKEKQILSISTIGFLYAPLCFTVSPLIGYFRGKLKSYDGLFYLLAAMNSASCVIILLLPKLASIRERKKLIKHEMLNNMNGE